MRDSGLAFISPVVVISPRALEFNTPVVSSILDVQGYEFVDFLTTGGDWLSGALAMVLVEHGDNANGSDMTPVPDRALYRSEADAQLSAADTVGRVGYKAATGKRYVRVTVTPSGVYTTIIPEVRHVLSRVFWNVQSGPLVGGIVDTAGFAFADFIFGQGGTTGFKWLGLVNLEHGDASDLSDAVTAVMPVTDVTAPAIGFGHGNKAKRIGYRTAAAGAKRYVRMVATNTTGDSGTANVIMSAELVNLPDANPGFGLIALRQSVRTLSGAL